MELSDISGLETVKERLAAAGPSGVSAPHCWFCGKVEAWFRCDCRDATAAREGKRAKPRVVERDGHMLIILDPEVMARPHNQGRKRYVPPVHAPVQAPEIVHETVDTVTPVTPVELKTAPASVTVTPTDPGVTPLRSAAAERMRRKRERDRAAKDT